MPQEQIKITSQKIISILKYIVNFYKNPIQGMKNPAQFDWLEILLLQFIVAFISGLISGIIAQNFFFLLWSVTLFPITALLISFIASLLIHYGIVLSFQKEFPISRTYTIVVLANLPFLAIRILSPLIHSIDIIGFLFTGFLISIALIEYYHLPKKKVIRYITILTAFIIISWLIQYILRLQKEGALFPSLF